ncbi:ribosomal protein s17 [Purpureocillium lavendulum]|uniref:Ribosomal protein s17 n=1 Tax=Purpureocillium lavendulum TaxID=1247861 RepID=A0AB34FB31_9HYPO|nr:ribosomal protein s17 [Purpureocillium lavendulum]
MLSSPSRPRRHEDYGGGVPSDRHDIRLWDVVVSMPEGPYGGVVQYDLVKDAVESFQLKGFLSPPPTRLRSAVELMRSDHLTAENKVEEFLLQMLQKGPRLSMYQRPSAGQDVLFYTDYDHVEGRSSCENCANAKTIYRLPRQFSGPEVHYGLIASGDRVMRSAAKRNATTANIGDILCFEMEAAGIATEFPCIVIRGISDYADSHKNDIWQHYAAAAAAASAKELLSYIAPGEPLSDPTPTSPGQDTQPPNRNEPLSQQLSGQGIQNAGSFSVGGNLHIQNIKSSSPTHDPCRDFLGDLYESNPSYDMSRIEREKGSLLPKCFDWILDNNELKVWQEHENARLLWVKGDPGKGKTMLMIGLARHLKTQLRRENCALAFFFCQNADQRLNNGIAILRGLVWMLLSKNPALSRHIPEEYSRIPREKQKAMLEESQNPNLFSTLASMLDGMLTDPSFDTVYLLVDALDECLDSDRLVEWMTQAASKPVSKAKWLVSSRFSLMLGRALQPSECQHKLDLDLNDEHISRAVARFIEQKVNDLAKGCKYDEQLRRKVQTKLEEKAESTFLWVSLICSRLAKVSRLNVEAEIDKFPPGLPALYDRMMDLIERDDNETTCKQILRAVVLVYRPLTLEELITVAALPNIQDDVLLEAVHLCGSYVIFREDRVRFLHQSAKDYLEVKYAMRLDAAGVAKGHADIGGRSIEAMSSMLRQNMYNLDYDFKPVDINPPTPDPLASIAYSCVFWVDHLFKSGGVADCRRGFANDGAVFMFLKERVLYWLESLSLLGAVPEGLRSIQKLLHMAQELPTNSEFVKFLEDAEKVVRSHRSIIEQAPLQAYGSALIFSPMSNTRQYWDAHRQTLASASDDRTVRLWDAATGAQRRTLEGHGGRVRAVAFSPDGKTLASASDDRTVRLWDAATGAQRRTLEGHGGRVRAVAFSPDGKTLASGSFDGTRRTLEGQGHWVSAVAFSPDGKTLATASVDGTVGLWDAATGARRRTLEGHGRRVWAVAFSPDGKTLASASDDRTVWLWDADTRQYWDAHRQTLEGHGGPSSLLGAQGYHDLRKELNETEFLPPIDADTTKANIYYIRKRFARFCLEKKHGCWKRAIKRNYCDKGLIMTFLLWICETYLQPRRRPAKKKTINQYWRDFKMLYRRCNKGRVVNANDCQEIRKYVDGTLKEEFHLDDQPKSKPVMGVDDLLLGLTHHWSRDWSVFPTEDDRLDLSTIMLFQAYTACRPAELVDGTKSRAGRDPMIDDPEVEDVVPIKSDSVHKLQPTERVEYAARTRTTRRKLGATGPAERRCEEDGFNSDRGSESAYDPESVDASSDDTSDTEYSDDDPEDVVTHEHKRLEPPPALSEPNEDEEPVRKHKALCYEDIVLWIVQDPNKAGRDVLAMEVRFRHHKGADKKPKPTVFLFRENPLPMLCPIAHILARAIRDDAVQVDGYRHASPFFTSNIRKQAAKVNWKPSILKRPVFRRSVRTPAGWVKSDTDPMKYSAYAFYLDRIGSDLGSEEKWTSYCLRRGNANALLTVAPNPVVDQVMRHDPLTGCLQNAYLNHRVGFNTQDAFLERDPSADGLTRAFTHMSIRCNPEVPKEVPKSELDNLEPDPDVVELTNQVKRMAIQIRQEYGFIKNAPKAAKQEYEQLRRDLKSADKAFRDDMTKVFQNEYRRRMHNAELERQLSGMAIEEQTEPSIQHALEERTQLQALLCDFDTNLSLKLTTDRKVRAVDLMVSLAARREVRKPLPPTPACKWGESHASPPSPEPLPKMEEIPLVLGKTQCIYCVGDEQLPYVARMRAFNRASHMMDHVEKVHLRHEPTRASFVCRHPQCKHLGDFLTGLDHFKNHVQTVHGVKLRK